MVAGMPVDLIRFFTLSLRQGVDPALAIKAVLLAPFYNDALHLILRIRNRQVLDDQTVH